MCLKRSLLRSKITFCSKLLLSKIRRPLSKSCRKKRDQCDAGHRQELLRSMSSDDVVNNILRHPWKDDNHQRAQDRAGERSGRHPGITLMYAKTRQTVLIRDNVQRSTPNVQRFKSEIAAHRRL